MPQHETGRKKHMEIAANGSRIQAVDYLKGFSIFTIVLMHLVQSLPAMPQMVQKVFSLGGTGVHVFFLCSGIGLYFSYLKKKTTFPVFINKRLLKVYIPYIIIVVISFLLPWMYDRNDRFAALLSHIFLFKMFVPQYEESFGIQLWFISTIIQMYLVFIPMCVMKEKLKNDKLFFGIFMAVSVLWWLFCYFMRITNVRIWSSFCLQNIWEFALGFVIAGQFHNGKVFRLKKSILPFVALTGIGLQAVMAVSSEALKIFNDIPALLGYTALALLLMNIPVIRSSGIRLSAISYELYLVHILIFETAMHFINPQGLVPEIIFGILALSAAVIAAYWYSRFLRIPLFRPGIPDRK